MSRVSTLYHLQEIDLERDACRTRLAEIENALSDNPALQAARDRLLSAETRQRAARVVLQELELENSGLGDKIREAEQRLYGGAIRNPKELRDLQAEIESLKRRLAAGEEQQLNALIETEVAETESAGSQAELQQVESQSARDQSTLLTERDACQARLRKLDAEREAQLPSILEADRAVYERLRHTKHGRPLSRLEDDTCTACGIAPSALIRQEARRGAELVRCTGCDRILYAASWPWCGTKSIRACAACASA
jgi:predicted  nucleic acid-binding Zn-ribbon protein